MEAEPKETGSGATGRLRYAWVCRTGSVRELNEDAVSVDEVEPGRLLVVVADGMGGHASGELASRAGVSTLRDIDRAALGDTNDERLFDSAIRAFEQADEAVRAVSGEAGRPPGCTAILAVVSVERCFHLHVGDCRLFHFRDGALLYRTTDQTVAELLRQEGQIDADAMLDHPGASMVLSCLGGESDNLLDVVPKWSPGGEQEAIRSIQPGDRLLLCSDGVSGVVPAGALTGLLAGSDLDPADATARIEQQVLSRGARDNYTAVIVSVDGAERSPEVVMPDAAG
jgi:protein phosphatase